MKNDIWDKENQKILQAMLLLAQSLNYSDTYKSELIEEIKRLIQ